MQLQQHPPNPVNWLEIWPEVDLAGFLKNGQIPHLPEPDPKSGSIQPKGYTLSYSNITVKEGSQVK